MRSQQPKARRLSAVDAFFVAYQESSGVLMQLGVEVELKGHIRRSDLEQMLSHVVQRWPQLGRILHKRLLGLSWEGQCRISEMLHVADGRRALAEWRNRPLDPFSEPPFQLLWIADHNGTNLLAFRAHHAVIDGEAFFAVCVEAVRALAGTGTTWSPSTDTSPKSTRLRSSSQLFRDGNLPRMILQLHRLKKESRSNRSTRLITRSCTPGETASVERKLEKDAYHRLQQQAAATKIAPASLCASAWIRAIHAWNISCGNDSNPLVSLEIPVSLRRGRRHHLRVGNFISPIVIYGDARQPLEQLATGIQHQLTTEVRRKSHLALPSLSEPARFLPWRLFRMIAASHGATGFATSHFTWFQQAREIHDEILHLSGGALKIVDQQIYTPVCLHMGAALAVLAWAERAQIFLTHRLSAVSATDAHTLLDLMIEELGQNQLSRRQVAV